MKNLILAFAGLVFLCACSTTTPEFDAGRQQAEESLRTGPPVVYDIHGAPGVIRPYDERELLVPDCGAPPHYLDQAIEAGARSGEELSEAIYSQTSHFSDRVDNRIEGDSFWDEGYFPVIVACQHYAPGEPAGVCTWLVLGRDAPVAQAPWVLGYNHRVIQFLAADTPCEPFLQRDVKYLLDDFRDARGSPSN